MTHARAWFVTGTDTGIGKTFVTCALLHRARLDGNSALGMKPVAAGVQPGETLNEDVAALRAASSHDPGLALTNPYCFSSAVAPHIAAAEEGRPVQPAVIADACARLRELADVVLVEGVGGFLVPLGERYDAADLARELALPVILVVGMRLGCINHALLTAEAVRTRGLLLAGWVANRIDAAMLRFDENLAALGERLAAPLLGVVPRIDDGDPRAAARFVSLPESRRAAAGAARTGTPQPRRRR
jgi:dethiobiotin synthetase